MSKRVGFPRAMGYYYFYPFFRTLLAALGAEMVLSPPTSARTLERMEICPTDEPCLAVKLHFGHVDTLLQHGDCDCVLLPVIAKIGHVPCCPKFIGIAEMIRHGLRLPDEFILMPVIDYSEDARALLPALLPLAARLGVPDRRQVASAIARAQQAQRDFRALCVDEQITIPEAYRRLDGQPPRRKTSPAEPGIAVIGHPYILYEPISQEIVERLAASGRVVTAEMVAADAMARQMATIPEGDRLWPFEAMQLGAALELLRTQAVEKMILVGSFECGPASIIETYIEHEAQRQSIPLMVLALDEHSGEAGLTTRLEAFLDTEKPTTGAHASSCAPATTQSDTGTRASSRAPAKADSSAVAGMAKADSSTVARRAKAEIVMGFPSMGLLDMAARTLVELCGVRTLPTPRTLTTCVELGREISPEFVCFPFVATLGQMRALLDAGANTLLMVGGKGACRLGWYAQVQETLLRNMGYDFHLCIADAPFPLSTKWEAFQRTIKDVTGGAPWPQIISAFRVAVRQLEAMDRAETTAHRLRAIERAQGTTNRVLDRALRRLAHARTLKAIRQWERDFADEIASIETEDTHPLRVRIAGEIWVVLEQTATRDVERWLGGQSAPRVWVEREHSATNWLQTHLFNTRAARRREQEVLTAAQPWLAHPVGGHGQHTIGSVALARREGIDGVLHIFPFTCMPEIIAQNIIVRVADELDTPVLTYIVSEQTGEAGMETRLESFLDLLEERRFARQGGSVGVSECRSL